VTNTVGVAGEKERKRRGAGGMEEDEDRG